MTYARDWAVVTTPIGSMRIEGDAERVDAVRILADREAARRPDYPAVLAAAEQLEAWFEGASSGLTSLWHPPAPGAGSCSAMGWSPSAMARR